MLLEVDDDRVLAGRARRAGCDSTVAGTVRPDGSATETSRRYGPGLARSGRRGGRDRQAGPAATAGPRPGCPAAVRENSAGGARRARPPSRRRAAPASLPGGPSTSRPWCAGTRLARATVTSAPPAARVDPDRIAAARSASSGAPVHAVQRQPGAEERIAEGLDAVSSTTCAARLGSGSRKRARPSASVGHSCEAPRPAAVAGLVVGIDDLEHEQPAGQPATRRRADRRPAAARARTRSPRPAGSTPPRPSRRSGSPPRARRPSAPPPA